MNPSVQALRRQFGDAIGRVQVSCGDTIVYVAADRLFEVMQFLKATADQEYEYLADITAVEYRDAERPIEVVYELFSLSRHAQFRVKV